MYLGLKIRIYPNSVQKKIIDEHIEGARYVYNYFLKYAKDNKIYDDTIWKKKLYAMMKNDNNDLLNNCDYFLLLTQLDVLKTSYDRFFRGTIKNEPYFKKKGALVSAFKIQNKNDSIKIEDNKIYIKMLGYMKFRNKKDISKNKIYSAIVKKTLDDIYEVSILYENTISPIEKAYQKVGIDLGVRKFITTSDSNYYLPIDDLYKIEARIRNLQKELSKKTKESNNWYKTKKRITKLYLYKRNYIKDTLDKATTELVKNYDVVFMEDLSIKELVQQQKSKVIRRKIIESSLYMIREMLTYKCKMYNKRLIFVERLFPSSKMCSVCGSIHDPRSSETFICPVCGLSIDRDLNAAINIYKRGMAKYLNMYSTEASFGRKPTK